ncbi:tetratricopeptide repeat protein [Bacteroides sedimenti]|uniref:tetratricopeptide repeat protein n=1 Tax=Bacteroides sedimenti TaxID=2136147 RepID=UPI00333EC771
MKCTTLLLILLFLTVAVIPSCHRGGPFDLLNQADTLLDTRPDSSFTLLKSLDSKSLSDEDNARYCLLMSAAMIKNSIPITSDSLINISLKFYNKHGDSINKAETYFYAGRVSQEMRDEKEAANYFLKAADYSEISKENKLKYLIYFYLGDLYFNQNLYDSSIKMQKKALQISKLLNDSSYITHALRSCALSYAGKKNMKMSLNYYNKALRYNKDTAMRIALFNEIGERYNNIGNCTLAIWYVNKAIELKPSTQSLFYCDIIKGNSYFILHKTDSAKYYYNKVLFSSNIYTRADSYYSLAKIAAIEGDYKHAFELMQVYNNYKDTIDSQTKSAAIIEMENIYQHGKSKEQIQQLILDKKEQTIRFYHWGLLTFALIIMSSGSFFIYRNNEKKRLLDKSRKLLEQENRLIMMRERDCRLREEFFRKLNNINKIPSLIFLDEKGEKNKKQEAEATTKISLTDREWEELIRNIDVAYDHFSERLKKAYPNLNNQEIRLCCLVKIKVARNDLANIFCITPQSIKTTKYRIKRDKMGINDREISLDNFLDNF